MALSWIAEMQKALNAGADPSAVQTAATGAGMTLGQTQTALAALASPSRAAVATQSPGQPPVEQLVAMGKMGWTWDGKKWIAPGNVANSSGAGLPVSFNQLGMAASLDSTTVSPVAAGFPIFQNMMELILKANADRRASIDQSLSIAQLFTELERISPTRAADMATRLGVTEGNVDLSFLNLFGTGTGFAKAGGPRIGGRVGNQTVSLPSSLSGQEQSFLGSNPNVAKIVKDVASKFGLPDIFERSAAGRIPTLQSIMSGGF